MLGERPLAEYGIVLAALSALVLVVRALLAHWKYVHDTTPKGSGNGDVLMRVDIKGLKTQMDEMVKIWTPERAKQQDKTYDYVKKNWDLHDFYDKENRPVWWMPAKIGETLEELLKESKVTNGLLEKFIALNTQEHNIIIRDIRASPNPWTPPNDK